jgi:hypothetical protein
MLTGIRSISCALVLATFVAVMPSSAVAQDASWKVSKSSGEVWIDAPGAQPAALSTDAVLTPGATVRTGANGRVLLMRGAETIMVSPGSVVQVPDKTGIDGMTSILQKSGSAVFDVEKKNVRHFEVATPYLAAVVKGTQFRVSVDEGGSRVEVLRGQVQVTDFKSGQRALVNQAQTAAVALRDGLGLLLSGSGTLSPIEYGSPQTPPVAPLSAPPVRTAAAMAPPSPIQTPAPAIAASRWSQPGSGNDSLWGNSSSASDGEGFMASLRDKLGLGRQRKAQDDMTIVAVPIAVGLSVILGAMVVRRRRNKPEDRA